MSRTPLALIRGVKKLCKDLGVDPEDVRTFRFFTLPPPPPSPHTHSHALVCLFVFFFPVLLMYGFLFHFCKTTLAMCMALQYKERSYYYYYHLPVLEAHVQQQFLVHFFKPHFATEKSKTFMSLSWMLADLFLSFCLCRL